MRSRRMLPSPQRTSDTLEALAPIDDIPKHELDETVYGFVFLPIAIVGHPELTDRCDDAVLFRLAEDVVPEVADRLLTAGVDEDSGPVAMAHSPPTAVLGPVWELLRPFPVLGVSGAQGAVASLRECDEVRF